MLRGVNYLVTGVSKQPIGSIFRDPAVQTAGPLKMGGIGCPETSVTTNSRCLTTRKTKDLTTDITLCVQAPWLSEYEIGVNAEWCHIATNRTDRLKMQTKQEELFIMPDRKFSNVIYVGLEMTGCSTGILVY
jgi:hypothetical protein